MLSTVPERDPCFFVFIKTNDGRGAKYENFFSGGLLCLAETVYIFVDLNNVKNNIINQTSKLVLYINRGESSTRPRLSIPEGGFYKHKCVTIKKDIIIIK